MRYIVSAIAAFAFFVAPANADTPPPEEIVTIVADSWCPYNCEPGSARPGFMVEIAQKALTKHNIKVQYSIMPWSRAIEETRQEKYSAIVGAAHKDAPDFIFPAIPQGWMQNSFYVKKGNPWRFADIESLSKVSLGIIADYAYGEKLDEYIAKSKGDPKLIQAISGDDALETNLIKLVAGRISALVEDEHVIGIYFQKHPEVKEQVEHAGILPPSDANNIFVAFSPKGQNSKKYADIITEETKKMRASGELQSILDGYATRDWEKQ